MRKFNLFNNLHLGDCLIPINFLRKVCEQNKDICFDFYVGEQYLRHCGLQIGEYSNQINLMSTKQMPKDKTGFIDTWFASIRISNSIGYRDGLFYSNERYDYFFNKLCEKLQVANPMPGKLCTVFEHPELINSIGIDCDILLINSISRSRYYDHNASDFLKKVYEWKDKYKVFTTEPTLPDVPNSRDHNLNLLQIGHLATKAQYVVGVDTAPLHNCFNKWALETVKKWFILSKFTHRSYNDRIFSYNNILKVDI